MKRRRKAHKIPKSASRWAMLMAKLRKLKPRPIAKLYGKKGPTPDQLAEWKKRNSRWNALYRIASAEQKRKLEIENEKFRAEHQ